MTSYDYDRMTVAELREHATERRIDLAGATRKADIIDAIRGPQPIPGDVPLIPARELATDRSLAAELVGVTADRIEGVYPVGDGARVIYRDAGGSRVSRDLTRDELEEALRG